MLTRAHEASQSQKLNYADEITAFIRQVRREKFRLEENKRIEQEIELQSYLNELIEGDVDRRIAELLVSELVKSNYSYFFSHVQTIETTILLQMQSKNSNRTD